MQISRIRLSDKTSRLHPRHVMPKSAQTYEPEVPVEVRGWIGPAPASPDLASMARSPFTTRPDIVGGFGVVAATHWIAAQAGMRMLELGGNAFDAAVASAFTLHV